MALGRAYYTEVDKTEVNTLTNANHHAAILWMWASFLVGLISGTPGRTGPIPASARWTVYGSSDGVTAGMDGDGRGLVGAMFDPSKWVRGTGTAARSWLVLLDPSGTFYLVMDWIGSPTASYQVHYRLTKTAPTGGSATSSPTITNDAAFSASSSMANNTSASGGIRGCLTTDASGHFLFMVKQAGEDIGKIATTVFGFWNVDDPHPDDLNPWFILMSHDASGNPLVDSLSTLTNGSSASSNAGFQGRSKTGGDSVGGVAGVLGGSASVFSRLGGGQDFIRGNDPAQPSVDLWITNTGQAGRRGTIPDWRCGAAKGDGYSDPNAANVERVLIGSFYVPMMAIPNVS